jgi:S1-C subfamily serine protease
MNHDPPASRSHTESGSGVDDQEVDDLTNEILGEGIDSCVSQEDLSLFGFYESPNHPKLRSGHGESLRDPQSRAAKNLETDGDLDPSIGQRLTQQDPLRQSLFLLATMAVLLLAARYCVPRIVEEIRYSWHRGELRAEYESGSEGLRNVSLDTLSRAYQMVTSTVGPSVVHIDVKQPSSLTDIKIQGQVIPLYQPQTDQGSGVIVAHNGFLLTNRHVIADGEEIYVTLGDGRRLKAIIVGTDKQTDLAVLKVDAEGLIPIVWGDSDRCRVGSPVWAVGSPFGLDQTVTFGILSGKHRMVKDSTHYQDFMQSDVAVNPGNSGGPLVDARGALVGINTAIVGESYQGVSFAVPSNVAKQVYERLRENGRVDRGWLGVRLSEVEDNNLIGKNLRVRGAVVSGLTNESSPAAVAGLKLGDHILTVDTTAVRDLPHLMRLIGGSRAGSDITLKVVREGRPLTVTVMLGARPDLLNQP